MSNLVPVAGRLLLRGDLRCFKRFCVSAMQVIPVEVAIATVCARADSMIDGEGHVEAIVLFLSALETIFKTFLAVRV